MKGRVYLVGAGPGDSGLITVKGANLLKEANVVVYDSLIGDGIRNYINPKAEMIYVGKRSGNHSKTQDEINSILVEYGLKGGIVVRLKGGDPFLFGRGGEEIASLKKAGIEYEVVPGVTSAIGAAAYAGIPVTHRGVASSLHIITGHLKDESYGINFKALASLNGTLVFLMGISALETITGSLISEGMDENTPCAVVESGTTSNQRVTISTLKGIKDEAKRVKIKSPGIIIVGDVCSLAKEYSWIENMPLFGTRILVTRPKEVASKLSTILEKRGASVTSINTISIDKIDRKGFLYAASNISDYKWAIFTSPSGVNEFFNCLKEEELDIRILYGVKIAAVGPSTAKSIESRGLIVDFIPSRYDGETLGKEIGDIDSCILFRAAKGNEEVVKILEARGVKCLDTPIYKTSSVKQNINVEDYDYITFTSKSCIEGFVESTGLDDYSNINAICIGETTARLGRSLSMNVYVSEKATLESMANLLEKIRRDNNGLKG